MLKKSQLNTRRGWDLKVETVSEMAYCPGIFQNYLPPRDSRVHNKLYRPPPPLPFASSFPFMDKTAQLQPTFTEWNCPNLPPWSPPRICYINLPAASLIP